MPSYSTWACSFSSGLIGSRSAITPLLARLALADLVDVPGRHPAVELLHRVVPRLLVDLVLLVLRAVVPAHLPGAHDQPSTPNSSSTSTGLGLATNRALARNQTPISAS